MTELTEAEQRLIENYRKQQQARQERILAGMPAKPSRQMRRHQAAMQRRANKKYNKFVARAAKRGETVVHFPDGSIVAMPHEEAAKLKAEDEMRRAQLEMEV